jgi:hypothetical protein
MAKKPKGFESFPIWIVLIYNFISLSLYAAGIYLVFLIKPWLVWVFAAYIVYIESKIYREGCRYCYYYGKLCGAGRGKLAKIFVKKGDPKKFCEKSVSFKDFIPSMLVSVIPIIAGIYLLIKGFNWFILAVTVWPLIVWFFGNPLIYGELMCPNCKQGSICCPVSKFFMEMEKKRRKK